MFGKMNYEKIFEDIFEKLKNVPDEGKVADYIPELARVNPDSFGAHLTTVDGVHYAFGDSETRFPYRVSPRYCRLYLLIPI